MQLIRPFFDANRRFATRLERRLPHARTSLYSVYETTVARYMNDAPGQLVLDVGGGKSCPFAKYRDPALGTRIVALDIAADEIRHNRDVDASCVVDVMRDLPFAPGEADLIVSRSVLEHLTDLDAFVRASHRVLKPGGYFIHLLPSRFAPFAMINRALPAAVSKRVLYFFHPNTAGICGFPAFYDRCYYSALAGLLAARGFELEQHQIGYYQSRYFDFFVPLYLLSVAYELAARAARAPNLGAYLLIVARRR